MKCFVLFTLFASASAMPISKHFFPVPCIGCPGKIDLNEAMDKVWNYIEKINEGVEKPNYLIPIKITDATEQLVQGMKTTINVLVGESNCAKSMDVSEVNPTNCHSKPNSELTLINIEDIDRWKMKKPRHAITITKLQDIPTGIEYTTVETPSSTGEYVVGYNFKSDKTRQWH